jgi:uncharacterized protein (DUF1778 family)
MTHMPVKKDRTSNRRTAVSSGKKKSIPKRRLQQPLTFKTFAYLTEEERETIREAADRKRMSVSSFLVQSSLRAAEEILSEPDRRKR